jgi:hypothetical protein
MAHVMIPDLSPRLVYSVGATAQSSFAVPFAFFDPRTDLVVYVDGALAAYSDTPATTTQFSVTTIGTDDDGFSGGTVVLGAAVSNATVIIERDVPIERTEDFPYPSPTLSIRALNRSLDTITAWGQQLERGLDRTVRLDANDPTASISLGSATTRAGRLLGFNPAGTAVEYYTPAAISGLGQVLPDGASTGISADLLIRKFIGVDIYAYGADPSASAAANDAAIALAAARANAIGGVLTAIAVPGTYSFASNLPALVGAAGLDMAGSIFSASSSGQTGAFLTIGSLIANGHQSKVVRGVRAKRATIADWTDATQIGVLLSCLQNTDAEIAEVDGFTIGLRCEAAYDGTTAADFVHNRISLGRIWRCKYAVDLFSNSPGLAGAPNNNRFLGGDITAQTGINTSEDRYGLCLRTRTWFNGTVTANAGTDELTLAGGASIPVNGRVTLSSTGTPPAGLIAGSYYVVASSGSNIKLSATQGGAAIDITDAGTGTHSLLCQGYQSHNTNLWIGPSFQHARTGTGNAYCVLSETTQATQNRITAARAEWTAPAVMRGSLTSGAGGPNVLEIDFATSYLRTELTDVVTGTKAAWRTENGRYSLNANDAMRPLLVIPNLRQTMFSDIFGGVISYGFDDLHVTYTTAPPSGDTTTVAEVVLRNSQNTATPGQDYITPATAGALIKAPRGIGVLVDTHDVKWLTFLWTQPSGARGGKVMIRQFDAAGTVLLSTEPVLIDHPSFTLAWDATARGWITSAEATDANQAGRLTFKLAEAAKQAQVAIVWGGTDITVQSFGIYTSEPYAARAWHGVSGGTRELIATATWDPASVPAPGQQSTTVTVTGANLGDFCEASFSLSQGALIDSAYVEGANTVRFILANLTAGAVDLASGTVTARVLKRRA